MSIFNNNIVSKITEMINSLEHRDIEEKDLKLVLDIFSAGFDAYISENKDDIIEGLKKLDVTGKMIVSILGISTELKSQYTSKTEPTADSSNEKEEETNGNTEEDKPDSNETNENTTASTSEESRPWTRKPRSEFMKENENYKYLFSNMVTNYTDESFYPVVKSVSDFNNIIDIEAQQSRPKVLIKIIDAFRHGLKDDGTFDMNLVYNLLNEAGHECFRFTIRRFYNTNNN